MADKETEVQTPAPFPSYGEVIQREVHFVGIDSNAPACSDCGSVCTSSIHKGSGLKVWRCSNLKCWLHY